MLFQVFSGKSIAFLKFRSGKGFFSKTRCFLSRVSTRGQKVYPKNVTSKGLSKERHLGQFVASSTLTLDLAPN